MLNYIEGQRLSNKKRVTKIHAFPSATTEEMVDFVRPLAYRSPDYLIIHAGTNDFIDFTVKDIIANFQDIVEAIIEIDPKIKIIFSPIIQRFDNDKLQPKVVGPNRDLQALCKKLNLDFIDNSNIVNSHIGQRGLHMNRSGKARLALNLKEQMNGL